MGDLRKAEQEKLPSLGNIKLVSIQEASFTDKEFDMEQFTIGEKVKLKSGGPIMTVNYVGEAQEGSGIVNIDCNWFVGDYLQSGTFSVGSLDKAAPDQGSPIAGGSRPSRPPI